MTGGRGAAESGDKKPKERHRRARSGHHKSASLGSFFPPILPPSRLTENASPGIQGNTGGTLDPLNRQHPNGSQQALGPSKLGRHHVSSGSISKEGDLNGSSRRRNTGTSDHEGHHHHRGGGGHRHHHRQDSTSTAKAKKKPNNVSLE